MAFIYQGNINGGATEPRISWEPAVSLTTAAGALVAKTVGAASIAAKAAYTTTEPIFGINKKTLIATDTVAEIENVSSGSILLADIDEILNGTVVTAAGAASSATTFSATALIGLIDDTLIGAQFKIASKAADATQVGNTITVTDFTSSTGTLTFATTTSAFATGDTLTLLNMGIPTSKVWYGNTSSLNTTAFTRKFVSNPYPVGSTVLALNSTATAVKIQIANNPGSHFKVLGTNDTGTKLVLLVLSGIDGQKVLTTA